MNSLSIFQTSLKKDKIFPIEFDLGSFYIEFPPKNVFIPPRKKDKIFPFKFNQGSFYKEFPRFFFYRKIPLQFFPTFKFEIEFHSHKKVVSPKLKDCAHLVIVNFKCAKSQRNQRTFLDR